MAKTFSNDMRTHLAQALTSLAQGWIMTRRDGQRFYFTTASRNMTIDIGDGTGPQLYRADLGYRRRNIQTDADLNVANTENDILFDNVVIKEEEMRRGLFNYAEVHVFFFNHRNLANGIVMAFRGRLGEVIVTDRGIGKVELRDLTEAFSHSVGEVYSKDCRADLGDHRCRHPLFPPVLKRGEAVPLLAVADTDEGDNELTQVHRRVFTDPPAGHLVDLSAEFVNLDFDAGDTSGWTVVSGTWAAVVSFTGLVPQGGTHFLRMTEQTAATREIRQDLELRDSMGGPLDDNLLASGAYRVAVSCYRANSAADGDTGRVILEALDAAGASLGIVADTTSESVSPQDTWSLRTVAGQLPRNAASLRLRLTATRVSGADNDAAFDSITVSATDTETLVPHEATEDVMYRVVTAGVTAAVPPVYDTTPGNQTTDGSLVVEAEHAWTRSFVIDSVIDPRRSFRVTQLTPNSGGPQGGFPSGWFNGGAAVLETGSNAGIAKEVREHLADDGVTILQTIELFEELPFDLQVGDKGRVQAGCDRVYATCISKFANWLNFVGEPFGPTDDVFGQYPDAQ